VATTPDAPLQDDPNLDDRLVAGAFPKNIRLDGESACALPIGVFRVEDRPPAYGG
jgi:hypothetical protein